MEEVIHQLAKSDHWIPAFPLDGRNSYGTFILSILGVWLFVFIILGATHRVMSASSFMVLLGVLILAYVSTWALSHWVNNPMGDGYLTDREKAFSAIIDAWNAKKTDKDLKMEVGRYGAYLTLRFITPVKKLGAFIMHFKRLSDKEKAQDKAKRKNTQEEDF